jgi:tetratricopeptide (TPR) repeat protein
MRKIIICIFLVLTFICSCSEKNETAMDWINKVKPLWNGKQYTDPNKAVEYLSNAIKLQPNDAEAYNNRGVAYIYLGQYQQAFEDFNKAIGLKQDYASAYNNRGSAYLLQGNNELGCPDAKKACDLGICKTFELAKGEGKCR